MNNNATVIIALVIYIVLCTAYGCAYARQIPEFKNGEAMTKYFEGFRSKAYRDSRGNWTVGYGFNLRNPEVVKFMRLSPAIPLSSVTVDRQISEDLFTILYHRATRIAVNFAGVSFWKMNKTQRMILVDMAYNLGQTSLNKFTRLRNCIAKGDYAGASNEMRDSQWYLQTGRRAMHHVLKFAEEK
jgi:lysozyme